MIITILIIILMASFVALYVVARMVRCPQEKQKEPGRVYAPMFDEEPRWSNYQVDRIYDEADLSNIGVSA